MSESTKCSTSPTGFSVEKIYELLKADSGDSPREYFEFSGGNVFSWSTKNITEEQKNCLYSMIVDNVIRGYVVPKQKLPDFYHNQILAEAIKGNRSHSVLQYLELTTEK